MEALRLGLRVEQRGDVKRQARLLKQLLDRTSADLQAFFFDIYYHYTYP